MFTMREVDAHAEEIKALHAEVGHACTKNAEKYLAVFDKGVGHSALYSGISAWCRAQNKKFAESKSGFNCPDCTTPGRLSDETSRRRSKPGKRTKRKTQTQAFSDGKRQRVLKYAQEASAKNPETATDVLQEATRAVRMCGTMHIEKLQKIGEFCARKADLMRQVEALEAEMGASLDS